MAAAMMAVEDKVRGGSQDMRPMTTADMAFAPSNPTPANGDIKEKRKKQIDYHEPAIQQG